MYRNKLISLIIVILLLSGCTKITNNLDDIVNDTMNSNKPNTNTVSSNYEIYIPTGVEQVSDSEYNQKFKIRHTYIYMYVDTISYYYKNMLNYKSNEDYNYYYKEVKTNNSEGYIGINKLEDDLYFCEIIYNYSKIEFYTDAYNLPVILANSLIIQKSIKYNDNLIRIELEDNVTDGREITYELDSPSKTETSFSDYLQEYVAEEESEIVLPDGN